jgi:hypothetical protein
VVVGAGFWGIFPTLPCTRNGINAEEAHEDSYPNTIAALC